MTRESDAYIDLTNILSNPTELSPCAYQYYKNLLKRTIVFNEDVAGDIMEKFTLPLLEWDNDGTGTTHSKTALKWTEKGRKFIGELLVKLGYTPITAR